MYLTSLYVMAAVYILAGLNHFRAPQFYLPMMPPWIPKHRFMVLASGFAEVVVGVLLIPQTSRSFAAWLLILMLVIFFSVHIYMIQKRDSVFKKISPLILFTRIPLQFVLIYWAFVYT